MGEKVTNLAASVHARPQNHARDEDRWSRPQLAAEQLLHEAAGVFGGDDVADARLGVDGDAQALGRELGP